MVQYLPKAGKEGSSLDLLEHVRRFLTGSDLTTEVDLLLATHGWWPWLLTLALILIVIAGVIAYFAKRRKAV